MELKTYQKQVMKNLNSYMESLDTTAGIKRAWSDYWMKQDVCVGMGGVPPYVDTISGVPHVCMKVPTGGGKTFMACASLQKIFSGMPESKPKVVVWLVPSDSILAQTIRTLSDVNHDYRQRLDTDFAGRVDVYTKDMLLNAQRFSPDTVREMLTVCIMSYGSLRIDSNKKDVRKVYQENGNLLKFAEYFNNRDVLLADTPDTALIQVLRQLEPVLVVDESHNAVSTLSVEMMERLNPSFILELTATPKKSSNIISYVDARELKKENMVKLPVIAYFRNDRQSVIQDAIQFRGYLERQAEAARDVGGEYIRPIVLFQAQPNTNEESETFDKIKKLLMDMGIPEEEIGIKTSKVDDISRLDLMSPDCPIRYIITVNALKEGWDCSFAYILASLANKTSKVDVEQILGRILRQPYTKRHAGTLLNSSYVFTCSRDFRETIDSILAGLNNAGFSRKDFRLGTAEESAPQASDNLFSGEQVSIDDCQNTDSNTAVGGSEIGLVVESAVPENGTGGPGESTDSFEDVDPTMVSISPVSDGGEAVPEVAEIVGTAEQTAADYEEEFAENEANNTGLSWGEIGSMLNQYRIQSQYRDEIKDLKIPQFFVQTVPDLFGDEYELLEPEALSEGFSLSGQNAEVNFELDSSQIYKFDVAEEGEAVPKYKKVKQDSSEYIKNIISRRPEERWVDLCVDAICHQLNRNNRIASAHLLEYVKRIVGMMDQDSVEAMQSNVPTYAHKIGKKIESLEEVYREEQFFKWLDFGKIICREAYLLPEVITPAQAIDAIPYSLYEAEKDDMNQFERQVLDVIVSLNNVRWWHRNIERKGFRLNGFINHYPDFIVMTKKENVILVESKGDYLDGDDSKTKLSLGRAWQAAAGGRYRYFMVFKDKEIGKGSYKLDDFVEVMKNL